MREAMMTAPLGDDVFGDDPSVLRLQEMAAERLGSEAALFLPSGTMANEVAIRCHTEPGDEIIVESGSHIFLYEGAGFAALSGVSARCLDGVRGVFSGEQVRAAVRPPGGLSHYPVSKLVCVENSANRGGGTVWPLARLREVSEAAREHSLRLHLDGARVWNAAVALGVDVREITRHFDSVSFCLSKGLGCPVGSLLCGGRAFVERAHRFRKMFGGGMRQAGVLAGAGIFALEHHVARLADDHARARRLAEALAALPGLSVDLPAVQTNMVYVDVAGTGRSAAQFVEGLANLGVLVTAAGAATLRAVTHLDVDDAGIERALDGFDRLARA
jgi:threonine aldolase